MPTPMTRISFASLAPIADQQDPLLAANRPRPLSEQRIPFEQAIVPNQEKESHRSRTSFNVVWIAPRRCITSKQANEASLWNRSMAAFNHRPRSRASPAATMSPIAPSSRESRSCDRWDANLIAVSQGTDASPMRGLTLVRACASCTDRSRS